MHYRDDLIFDLPKFKSGDTSSTTTVCPPSYVFRILIDEKDHEVIYTGPSKVQNITTTLMISKVGAHGRLIKLDLGG